MITCILDGKEIQNKEMLHDVLTVSLHFPDWYGRNLDALYDCLTDIQEEVRIQFLQKDILKEHLGEYTDSLIKVVHMSAKDNSNICVQFL